LKAKAHCSFCELHLQQLAKPAFPGETEQLTAKQAGTADASITTFW